MSERTESEYERLRGFYAERVAGHERDRRGYAAAWDRLCAAVLPHGGDLVVPPCEPEPQLEEVVARLEFWPGRPAVLKKGQPNRCHGNSAELWLSEQVDGLATGYALSDDGLWRQHTWGLRTTRAGETVVETTCRRDGYVGCRLEGIDALRFAAANVDPRLFENAVLGSGRAGTLARTASAAGADGTRP